MPTALVPLVDGFEETEAITVIDLLRRSGVEVTTAGAGKTQACGSHEIVVKADVEISTVIAKHFDAIVLPGGPGTPHLNDIPGLHDRLRLQVSQGLLVAAICAAPTVLAAAGLLGGKRAACFPSVEGKLTDAGATVLSQPVVQDGNVITSRGVGTAIDFALAVAARLVGDAKADQVARAIVYRV